MLWLLLTPLQYFLTIILSQNPNKNKRSTFFALVETSQRFVCSWEHICKDK